MLTLSKFGIWDYVVLIGTLIISMLIGFYFAVIKKQKSTFDMFLGRRRMCVFPVSFSLLANYISGIFVLGFTGEIYAHGTLICEMVVGTLFYVPLAVFLFLPTLYKLELTSVYEYLEFRFESRAVRLIASATFIVQVVLYLGVVLYSPAIAIMDMPVWACILIVGFCAAIQTAVGGIKAVVWTDTFQVLMMVACMIAIIVKGTINVGSFGNVRDIASANGRIDYSNFKFDPFVRHTTLNIFFGQGTYWLSTYGCHQATIQRYRSLGSQRDARKAAVITMFLLAFTLVLGSLSGVVIYSNYAGCDPISLGLINTNDQIAPHFVAEILSPISGFSGFFISCLLCGALSTVSSGLNTLVAVTWEDIFKRSGISFLVFSGYRERVIKWTAIAYGLIAIAIAFISQNLGCTFTTALMVNGAISGPLLGVFFLGVILPFVNKKGAIAGMVMGHIVTIGISIGSFILNRKVPNLPFRIDQCSNTTLSSVNMTAVYMRQIILTEHPADEVWLLKIFTLSYTLYPLIGALTTIIVGSLVSWYTEPLTLSPGNERYIHPKVVELIQKWRITQMLKQAANADDQEMSIIRGRGWNPENRMDNPNFHCRCLHLDNPVFEPDWSSTHF